MLFNKNLSFVLYKFEPVSTRNYKWSEVAASKVKKMCPNEPKIEMAPLKSVYIKGFHLLPGSPIRLLKSCLQEELGVDTENIWHMSYRGKGITQLVMVASSIPSLIAVAKGNKFGFIVVERYNPRLPDDFESSAEALSRFDYRMVRDITRLKHELTKVYKYATVTRMREVLRYLEAYRTCTGLEPILEPARISYLDSAFDSNADCDSLRSTQC